MTVADVVCDAVRRLRQAGFAPDESVREAGVLARAWLGWDLARWLSSQSEPAPAGLQLALEPWAARRAAREPSAYITGRREFYGREFRVTRDVLIPRPETELLVEAARDLLAPAAPSRAADGVSGAPKILDVGTGSGCLAVTLALEHPVAHVTATDVSAAALAVAANNARAHGVDTRIVFEHAALTGSADRSVDLVVSNPPYVAEGDLDALAPDVRDYEPRVALVAGRDGLDVVREVLPAAARALRPGGAVAVEIGHGQAAAVEALLDTAGFHRLGTRRDLAGTPRVVMGRLAPL